MKLWLDCEFNGWNGQLISMALVAEDGREFYEVLPCESPVEWVAENVMPHLGKPAVSQEVFADKLRFFLQRFLDLQIIADWPDDIAYFCKALITGPGERIVTPPLAFYVIEVQYESEVPHNALCDARAIRAAMEVLA